MCHGAMTGMEGCCRAIPEAARWQNRRMGGPFLARCARPYSAVGRAGCTPWCREKPQKPLYAEVHKQLETFDFREPYRIGEVQSLGEKRAFRRIIGRLRRSGVQSSNEKSLLLLGLIANEFARRIHGRGRSGGAKGIRTDGTIPLATQSAH